MIELGKAHYLLFDGDCGICTAFAEMAQRLDRKQRFRIEPYQRFTDDELQSVGASFEKCSQRIHLISRRGRIVTGAFAINYFFWLHLPWSLLVALLHLVPVLLLLEIFIYEIIARNRRRISHWLGLRACAIENWPVTSQPERAGTKKVFKKFSTDEKTTNR